MARWHVSIQRFSGQDTPKYPDFIRERVYALCNAAQWWYEYRGELSQGIIMIILRFLLK